VLTPRHGESLSALGASVAMSGGTIVAGAGIVQGPETEYTAAVVFQRTGSRWKSQHDTADLVEQAATSYLDTEFPVAMSATTIVVGCDFCGQAWVFARPTGGWVSTTAPSAQLTESHADSGPGDSFGAAVAVQGSTVMVSASGWGFAPLPLYLGAVYLYAEPAGGWASAPSPMSDTAALHATGERMADGFGDSIAVSGNLLSVGAAQWTTGHHYSAGEGFVLQKPAAGWPHAVEIGRVRDPGAHTDDGMGGATAIDGTSVAFGAFGAYKDVGAVDVFTPKAHA
jgi:hypothetical protein